MRQRAMIAMALITEPGVLIADEPTTALDVTVQAQIIALLKEIQNRRKMSILFITHNLGVVAQLCDRVMVMYAGKIMETAPVRELFLSTAHPYTRALMKSLPSSHVSGEQLYGIKGMPPDPAHLPPGCPFEPRCEFSSEACKIPCSLCAAGPGHYTACTRIIKGEIAW